MPSRAVRLLLVALSMGGVTAAPRTVAGTVLFETTLDELSREADLVAVIVPTVQRRSFWHEGHIVTDVLCEVTVPIRGAAATRVVVRLPGGVVGAVGQTVAGAPVLSPGVPVVAFLSADRNGCRTVLSMAAGILPLSMVAGQVRVLPARTEGITFLPGPPSSPPRVVLSAGGLPLGTFVARIRAVPR
jgi:hypothetical protein